MRFARAVAAGILLAASAAAPTAAQQTANPWKRAEQPTLDAAVAAKDLTLILRVLASSIYSPEMMLAMSPVISEIRSRYRADQCAFFDEITHTDFSDNPYFAPVAAQLAEGALPPELRNAKVIGKLASYIAYMAGTGEPPACVCAPMPVPEVARICRAHFAPVRPEDAARYDLALNPARRRG